MPPLYRLGSTGPEVREIQSLLNAKPPALHAMLVCDGIFGPKTDARTREFQKNNALSPDGIIGPLTLAKLTAKPLEPCRPYGCRCGNCDPSNQTIAMVLRNQIATSARRQSDRIGSVSSSAVKSFAGGSAATQRSLPFGITIPSMPTVQLITATQIAAVRGVYGSSLDYSRIYISDKAGAQNRPFTVAVPATPLTPAIQIMNCGTLNPSHDTLIHELGHVWQSQHHADPTKFMAAAVKCQALALTMNAVAGKLDPSLAKHPGYPENYPYSAYYSIPGATFTTMGAEMVAQAIEKADPGVRGHVKGVSKNAVDGNNTTSLGLTVVGDRRIPGGIY